MIVELGEGFGGVFGGKRGVLRLNLNVSLPLRFRFSEFYLIHQGIRTQR